MTSFDSLQSALTYAYDAALAFGTLFLGGGFILHVSDRQTAINVKERQKQIAQAAALQEATPLEMPLQIKPEAKEKVLIEEEKEREQMPSPWES
jgi:hypothetical protein